MNWLAESDKGLLQYLGQYLQKIRLEQNKTQAQVSAAADINRSTLSQFEKGRGGTLLSLFRILRVLGRLDVLSTFEIENKISPLQIAKIEQKKRQRARGKSNNDHPSTTDW